MQGRKTAAGVQNLKTLVATSPSARILDLHGMAMERGGDPDYAVRPMFEHPALNRSIIVKHNVRPGEDEPLAPRRFNTTKVIFPFDPTDLHLGGQYMFVGQPDFEVALTKRLEYGDQSPERDIAVLKLLDSLPTLDPFLLGEVLVKNKIEVDNSYFRLSEPDKAHMLGFVESQIAALIELCFGETHEGDTRAKRLSQLLLADHESPELEPLQMTLRMEGEQFADAMFAWKAFLYYRWRSRELAPELKATMRSIALITPRRYETDGLRFVLSAKELLETTIARTWREITQNLLQYDRAYDGLTRDQNPETFRQFLTTGSTLFVDLGERIGRLEQICTFWDYRLAKHSTALSPEEVMDAMRDLLQGLSIWPANPLSRPVPEPAPPRRAQVRKVAAG
jgi:hypothetical protein